MNSEVPARFSAKLWVCFTVDFSLPLVLTNGLKAKQLGALAPLTEQIKIKKIRNYLDAPILRQKIGIFVDVDVGTHGRASLHEKILVKTGAKRAFFDQNSPS